MTSAQENEGVADLWAMVDQYIGVMKVGR